MDPSIYEQLQGKRNARAWKRKFKVAALGKGVWDVFTGVYTAVQCPEIKDYGLENAQDVATGTDKTNENDKDTETGTSDKGDKEATKPKRKARTTLGPDEINDFIKFAAKETAEQKKGLDFNSRMTLYKFTLDEYDKGRKITATALALLINWVHESLRGQLESFTDPKQAYEHLLARYSVTDARAREMAENQFNSIYITRFTSAQDYINAIENSTQDILEAGGYCDDPMIISKIIRGLRGHPMYKDFATQYHLLRDIDTKFEDLDHVITQLLTFESTNFPEPDFRFPTETKYRFAGRNGPAGMREQRKPREKCTACGIWGHNENVCRKSGSPGRPDLGFQNNGYERRTNNVNKPGNAGFGNNFKRGPKPNGMAASAIMDNKAFAIALENAKASSMKPLSPLKGTTSTPTPRTLAKNLSQATSLENTESKGELAEGGDLVFRKGAFQECLFNVPGSGVCDAVFLDHASNVSLRGKFIQHEQCPNSLITRNRFALLDPNTSLENDEILSKDFDWKEIVQSEIDALRPNPKTETQGMDLEIVSTNAQIENQPCDLESAFLHVPYDHDLDMEDPFHYDETLCGDYTNVCMTASNSPVQPNAWILDSGANIYICNDARWFTTLYTFDTAVSTAGQQSAMRIAGGGVVELQLKDGDGDPFTLTLNDVAYAPTSRCNLLSISKLAQAGVHGCWGPKANVMQLKSEGEHIIGNASMENGLYHLDLAFTHTEIPDDTFVANVDFDDPVWKEHRRLGHLSLQRMIQLTTQSLGMKVSKEQIQAKLGQICPICATTKAIVRLPRDPAKIRYKDKGQLVHVDIWGPYSVIGWDNTRWMLFSTDDATRATKTIRPKALDDFPQLLRELHKREERKYQLQILRYRVDNQFNNGPWKEWCTKKGIAIEPIAPHTHHQNGVAERLNRTLREGASAMIQDNAIGKQIRQIIEERGNELLRNSTLPETLWPEAMEYAAWLKNRTPTRAHKSKKTPWEIEEGHAPDLSRERTWGSRVYVSYTDEERGRKLHDPRGWLGYFVGCENESTYRVWNPADKKVKRVVYSVVEDGQGLDDTHDGPSLNDRIRGHQMTRTPENIQYISEDNESVDEASDIQTDENEASGASDAQRRLRPRRNEETVSRFFAPPAAMVTTRSELRKQTGDREPLMRDDSLNENNTSHQDLESPNLAFEETHVPRIADTIGQTQDSPANSEDEYTTSPFFEKSNDNVASRNNDNVASEDNDNDEEEFGEFQSSMIEEDSFHSLTSGSGPEIEPQSDMAPNLPPIPERLPETTTANQLPFSDSENDSPDTNMCQNKHCQTPHSRIRKSLTNGLRLCDPCHTRWKRNPTGNWQKPERRIKKETTCENEWCSTPNSLVSIGQRGPNNEILCFACYQRYQRFRMKDDNQNPDAWKTLAAGRSRKGVKIGPRQGPQKKMVSSDSESDKPLRTKRNEGNRGSKLRARVPDREKCQSCFDYATNCVMEPDGKCTRCKAVKRICRPLQLNPDGSLPTERKFAKTPINDNTIKYEDGCYRCLQQHVQCDAQLPISPKNPCTRCKKSNIYCVSKEHHQRAKDTPACLNCIRQRKHSKCDRGEPCDICIDTGHSRCTYEVDDGIRWLTTLTNPIPPDQRQNTHDGNADYYELHARRPGCTWCQKVYPNHRGGMVCGFEQGGPPCNYCFTSKSKQADRCTNYVAPGKIESVATRMFMMDDETNELVRDPAKSDNLTRSKRPRGKKDDAGNHMSTSDSSQDSEKDKGPIDIYSEESRAATRRKLMSINLPDAFLTAMSLVALDTTVNNALRPDPQSYAEAMRSPDSRKWKDAMQAEYDSLIDNQTWKVTILPPGRKALTTKWVLKKKLGPSGEILKYKARMVARGFQQVEGYDYTETYSGVVKAAAYRLLFALMILNGWTCHQMDVSTAFLNGDILEEIYIHPPQGYPHPGKVLRLQKALYGLKQSPRQWYRKLREWLLQNGWTISKYDECVFYNHNRRLIITVYVDDINIFGQSDEDIVSFKNDIAKAFKMTNAGRAAWYLGMQLQWLDGNLHIHQNGFIQQALGKYGLLGCKPASIPLDPTRKLVKETNDTADAKFKTMYMSMVGSLNYLQTKTVWGLAFPVSLVSRFMTNPNQTHLDAVLQIFRYLAGNSERGLVFRKNGDPKLRGFVDSDWGGDTDTGKSTTGWVFTLAGSPISWSSQRQKTVSSSSTEAEYIAASDACKEAIWLKGFHNEIAPMMNHPEQDTIPLSIDNASALKLTKNPEFHGRTKHINIRYHFIRECVERGEIIPEWISGKANPADLFTKPLAKPLFLENIQRLGSGVPDTSEASKAPDQDV